MLPIRPLRCPACGVELIGPTVAELVTTLRAADCLVEAMRAEMLTAPAWQPQARVSAPSAVPRQDLPEVAAARSWFAGKSVAVILLILGALCVLAAGAVFIAVAWMLLPLAIRALILIMITAGFGFFAQLALRRRLQASAETMAAIACGMFVLDVAAARRARLPGLADLAAAPYEIAAGVLLVTVAGAGAFTVRSRQRWLWSLDAAVALGMARAALGALRVSGERYALCAVSVTVIASLLYGAWRRLRFPVAMWSAGCLGAMAWLAAVALGSHHAADRVGSDVGRLAQAWPALTVALVAGLWSIALTDARWRRVSSCLCLLPVLILFEIVGWSHGWVVGAAVMLLGYVIAALASQRVPAPTPWSSAVGGSALVLGLSSVVGLLPTLVALATRIGLARVGIWRGPGGLPLDLASGDVGPWLLPLTTVVVLALLPRITIEGHRVSLDQHHTAGAFVATLGVLPVLYGAGFWTSMTVLVAVAVILLCAARLWRQDWLLVPALTLLLFIRICAYYDDLADPLAWTLIALFALAWALTEARLVVRAGFLTVAGLFALAGVAQWLTFAQAPRPLHGLVIVVIGSLGLLASQRWRATALTRGSARDCR